MLNLLSKTALIFCACFLLMSISSFSQITVDFEADKLEGCEVANVSFTDLSTSSAANVVEWTWSVGSLNSAIQNPGFILNQIGTYDVCLTVRDAAGNEATTCKENYINIHPNPVADFSFIQLDDCSPAEVIFSHTGSADISSWVWDVGGSANIINSSDPGQEIKTIYESGGQYSISVIVEDQNGCSDILTVPNAISVNQSPNLEYQIINPPSCTLPVSVNFANLNIEAGINYSWDFGNGETFEGATPPEINYENDDVYYINISATSDDCQTVIRDTITIATNPSFNFNYPNSVCQGNEFRIRNTESFNIDSITWMTDTGLEFKGSNTTRINIQEPGCYFFSAIVFIGPCSFQYTITECIEITSKPNVDFDISMIDPCTVPTQVILNASSFPGINPIWNITGSNDQSIVLESALDTVLIKDIGTYQISFSYEESPSCIHHYELDPLIVDSLHLSFPSVQLGGCVPIEHELNVDLHSLSPINYLWEIPDFGITSTSATVSVELTEIGAHDVILTVNNENGCEQVIELEDYIAAGMKPTTGMDFTPLTACGGGPFNFFDQSSGFANESYWVFSDSILNWVAGFDIEKYFSDTGYIDVIHTSAHFGCPGDTIVELQAIYVDGPIALFDHEIECGGQTAMFSDQSIDAEQISWSIVSNQTEIFSSTDQVFSYEFPTPGVYTIILEAFNPSTGCESNFDESIIIYDPDPMMELDTTRGCVPLEVEITYEVDPTIKLEVPEAEIIFEEPGRAILLYADSGVHPPPYLLRQVDETCTDTIRADSIYVNEVFASFFTYPVFCAPEVHPVTNTSTSLFGEITGAYWDLQDGIQTSNSIDAEFLIEDDNKYKLLLAVEDSWNCVDTFIKANALRPILLEVDFEVDTFGCTHQEFNFINTSNGVDITSVEWDFGDGEKSSLYDSQHSFENEGIYNVCLTAIESVGCEKTFCRELEIRNPIAQFTADPTAIDCPPLLVNFTNLSQHANEFQWDFGDNSGISPVENPSHIYNEVDLFDVRLIASHNGMCPDTAQIVDFIQIFGPRGEWKYDIKSSCVPLEVEFYGVSDGPYEFTWDFGDGNVTFPTQPTTSDTVQFTYSDPGVFTPILFLDNGIGCIVALEGDDISVTDIDLGFDVLDSIFCVSPGIIELENNTTHSADTVSYTWTFFNEDDIYTDENFSPSFSVVETGEYEIKLVAASENCIDSISVEGVQTIEHIDISIENDTICYDDMSTLHALGQAYDYNWYDSEGNYLNSGENLSVQLQESTEFILEGVRESCPDEQVVAEVFVHEPITIELEESYVAYTNLSAQVMLEYSGNYAFNWTPASGLSCSQCPNPSVKPDTTTIYQVEITDLDSGCRIDTTIEVRLIEDCTKEGIFSPNVFHVSNGSQNNRVRVYAENEDEFISLSIYDRWGNEVFFSEDIEETWDGTYNGQVLASGVYIMKIEAFCISSNEHFVSYRDISLLK